MAFELDGRITTGHREIFGVDMDLRVFKRWGCLVYIRIDKTERDKFGAHGLFGILMGLHGYKFEDYTYEVHCFRTKAMRHTRDIVFMEDIVPFLHGRELLQRQRTPNAESPFPRRTLGHLTPNIFSRVENIPNDGSATKDGIASPECISPGWSDASFVHATSNMARDPAAWMPVNDTAASPILKGDIIVTPNADTTVVAVNKNDIVVQIDGTSERFHLSPLQSFFQDDVGLVHRNRPQRKTNQRVLYNATHLGGTPPPIKKTDDGSELVGTSFWATVSPKATQPSHYIITDVGDPTVHAEMYNGRPPRYLRCVKSEELGGPSVDDDKRDSTVQEIRKWIATSKTDPTTETTVYLLDLEKTSTIGNASLIIHFHAGCDHSRGCF